MSTTHIVGLLPNGIQHIRFFPYLPTKSHESANELRQRMEWRMDLMARAWETQGKSTVKLPGQAASRLGKEKNSENLAGTQARSGYISRISEGHGRHGTVKTSKISDMVFLNELKPSDVRLLPLYLGKSSPIKACRDYGCLETQGKQWACISGLPAMGAMAIERGG
ncbi:hypothetical protein HO133_001115 [Letharia lupina]|uniref:Uncharacterized protein n=1 Tax=Letharia lupina TaxID=560253 RepID=A0A8H6CGE4_9LECA|nr:uncharacterized protein HO133_001115 [Letharia lupina]KAF6223063.1 hypothetical protein HO133_001115 [Letharia lupina]